MASNPSLISQPGREKEALAEVYHTIYVDRFAQDLATKERDLFS
jgi:hypothetical protein